MSYDEKRKEIINDNSCSFWMKKAMVILDSRDVVDSLNELEVLRDLMMLKFEEARKGAV